MELRIDEISNYLLVLMILVSASNGSTATDVRGKTLSRGTDRGMMAYAKFKAHKFSLLNITNIGSDYVLKGSECGLACVNIPSCFSFNLAAFSDIANGKIFCDLLPSDIYNDSKKFVASQFHHHYSIASPCISWPCQNNGTCVAHYEKNSYACVCAKGCTGKYCETAIKKDCAELYQSGMRNSGVHTINPDGLGAFDVFCDQTTAGGGWSVFQKRKDGSVGFHRGWAEYKRGFGNLNGEFWLGLDKIHRMTSSGGYKLRVDLEDFAGNITYAEYASFGVGSESTKYQLTVANYSGTARDSLAYHNGYPFTTKDQDNDNSKVNCAVRYKGAWWYNRCLESNLNGIYHHGQYTGLDGVWWYYWKRYSAKRAEMKIRPVNY